ncbi:hypothetical protein M2192_005915 [Bradyrhizobium elkanii USDA 61]|nr:hypothetical protein [Bradyrhizobium elkanii]MCS3581669.1 hypothetical protein [Bradyrhizobium elkanii]MCS3724543.1 hypothetical protein [Bradyrhizobium elkanii]MCS4008955.1 hypothetical protein [Bradyrhizobium elkanii USDA 61]BBB94826.1 hypothetical protein BE61_02360 [Bradyrhizobium elkanii USDA 61]
MTQVEVLSAARDHVGGYKVDVTRGERVGRVSSEWFSRPADERYLSLSDLYATVRRRTERSRTRTLESAAIRVEAAATMPSASLCSCPVPTRRLTGASANLSAWRGAPAAYLRQLPGPLAGISLRFGLSSHRAEQLKTLEIEDGRVEPRAATGPRIWPLSKQSSCLTSFSLIPSHRR